MKRFRMTRAAKADLTEITDYIAADNPQAARRVLVDILDRLERIGGTPGMGPRCEQYGKNLRRFAVGNYVIYYKPTANGISVIRVLHGARNVDDILG